ncbi:hypothetical protein GGX14DRAFT_587224 [Mycena pura]|uniref:DUF659 domain-containing protein n=1 Tax=Mycena pura TaxID=153505 RepID=A0AAD6UW87_9AGAR|nr:hypothetical protein GGX14DRAFT_587224 [Mycena pura]
MASLTANQLQELTDASERFVAEKNADIIKIEALMESVFGDYASRVENPSAREWAAYFNALVAYDEETDTGEKVSPPLMPGNTVLDVDDLSTPRAKPLKFLLKLAAVEARPKTAVKRKKADSVEEDTRPTKKKPGRQSNPILDKLSIPGVDEAKATANKHFWRCIAPECSFVRQGRRMDREVLKHASNCSKLQGAKLGLATVTESEAEPSTTPGPVGRPPKLSTPDPGQTTLRVPLYSEAGRERVAGQNKTWMDGVRHRIMLLICCGGVVPDVLERPEWNDLMDFMNPAYTKTSTRDMSTHISSEATLIDKLTNQALQKHNNSTLTLDGTDVKRGEEVYTEHACTPDRKVYFLGGHIGTTESRNAEWIKNNVLKTLGKIGQERFAAINSDSTNTTLAARREIVVKVPTMLDLCDVVHFLQHVIGDINMFPEFQSMMLIIKPLIRHFSKSGSSKAHLRVSGTGMAEDGDDLPVKALAKIGKTRFATHLLAVQTLEPALPRIHALYQEGKINFTSTTVKSLFSGPAVLGSTFSLEYTTFNRDLLVYQAITTPIARALWALEATTANASDAFIFWSAIANALDSLFSLPRVQTGIDEKLAQRVHAVFNDRYKEFFTHNELYFVAFCLDPRYPKERFLRMQKDEPASAVPNHIPFPHAYLRVKEFLKKILKSLHDAHEAHKTNGTSQTCSCHPLIKVLDQDVLNRRLASQLVACWLGEAPFHSDLIDNDINEWLRNLALGSSP